jgi:3',5'-cyclic-AMP phosphodiesterase
MQRNKITSGIPLSPYKPARRRFIKQVTTGAAGLGMLSAWPARGNGNGFPDDDGDGFHFVHLTDQHVRRARKGDIGYRRCIERVNNLDPKPDFVLMGGDGPFDGLYTDKSEFEDQIKLFTSNSEDLEMPYYHCIGNHDILGYSARRKVPISDPDIGKKFFMDLAGMEKSYYSFDFRGWHFVVLDSIFPIEAEHGPSYVPRIGPEQLDWLRYDLGAHSGIPTVAVTHIAAFCNIGQITGDSNMPSLHSRVLQDGRELREILERHRVKALLQGHSHIIEDYYYNGVWYITSQAVSAAWWGGNWLGFNPGFTVLTTRGNSLSWKRYEFDWEHHLEPEDDLERERIAEREEFLIEQERLLQEERAGILIPQQ